MARLVRKNVFLDPEVLRRAQEILGAQSESEATREALNLVAFRQSVVALLEPELSRAMVRTFDLSNSFATLR